MLQPLQDLASSLITPSNALAIGKAAHSRSELAEIISGSTDHKSKAYKAAARNLQRYDAAAGKQQRKASPATLEKLANALQGDEKAQVEALAASGESFKVSFSGEVKSSEDVRQRSMTWRISPEEVKEIARAGSDANQFDALWMGYGFIPDRAQGAYSFSRT